MTSVRGHQWLTYMSEEYHDTPFLRTPNCTLREQPITGRLKERVNVTPFFGVLPTTWCHCACSQSLFRKVAGTLHALRCGRYHFGHLIKTNMWLDRE